MASSIPPEIASTLRDAIKVDVSRGILDRMKEKMGMVKRQSVGSSEVIDDRKQRYMATLKETEKHEEDLKTYNKSQHKDFSINEHGWLSPIVKTGTDVTIPNIDIKDTSNVFIYKIVKTVFHPPPLPGLVKSGESREITSYRYISKQDLLEHPEWQEDIDYKIVRKNLTENDKILNSIYNSKRGDVVKDKTFNTREVIDYKSIKDLYYPDSVVENKVLKRHAFDILSRILYYYELLNLKKNIYSIYPFKIEISPEQLFQYILYPIKTSADNTTIDVNSRIKELDMVLADLESRIDRDRDFDDSLLYKDKKILSSIPFPIKQIKDMIIKNRDLVVYSPTSKLYDNKKISDFLQIDFMSSANRHPSKDEKINSIDLSTRNFSIIRDFLIDCKKKVDENTFDTIRKDLKPLFYNILKHVDLKNPEIYRDLSLKISDKDLKEIKNQDIVADFLKYRDLTRLYTLTGCIVGIDDKRAIFSFERSKILLHAYFYAIRYIKKEKINMNDIKNAWIDRIADLDTSVVNRDLLKTYKSNIDITIVDIADSIIRFGFFDCIFDLTRRDIAPKDVINRAETFSISSNMSLLLDYYKKGGIALLQKSKDPRLLEFEARFKIYDIEKICLFVFVRDFTIVSGKSINDIGPKEILKEEYTVKLYNDNKRIRKDIDGTLILERKIQLDNKTFNSFSFITSYEDTLKLYPQEKPISERAIVRYSKTIIVDDSIIGVLSISRIVSGDRSSIELEYELVNPFKKFRSKDLESEHMADIVKDVRLLWQYIDPLYIKNTRKFITDLVNGISADRVISEKERVTIFDTLLSNIFPSERRPDKVSERRSEKVSSDSLSGKVSERSTLDRSTLDTTENRGISGFVSFIKEFAKPVDLEMKHLETIGIDEYIVKGETIHTGLIRYYPTIKYDGERCYLYVFNNRNIYILKHSNSQGWTEIKLKGTVLYYKEIEHSINYIENIVAEGEYMNGILYLFDIVHYKGDDIRDQDFLSRLAILNSFKSSVINEITDIVIKEYYGVTGDYNFYDSINKAIDSNRDRDLNGNLIDRINNDGLVLQPAGAYNEHNIYKWKPIKTVDLKVNVVNDKVSISYNTKNKIYVDIKTITGDCEFITTYPISADNGEQITSIDDIDGKIVEYMYDPTGNRFVSFKYRIDKTESNFETVVKSIWRTIENEITELDIRGLTFILKRRLNNRIKTSLINDNIKNADVIIDIGTGNGGDLNKYLNTTEDKERLLLAIEPFETHFNTILDRYTDHKDFINKKNKKQKDKKFKILSDTVSNNTRIIEMKRDGLKVRLINCKAQDVNLLDYIKKENIIDKNILITSFFSLTFFTDNDEYNVLLKNISDIKEISKTTRFLATVMDGIGLEAVRNVTNSLGNVSKKLYTIENVETDNNVTIDRVVLDTEKSDPVYTNEKLWLYDDNIKIPIRFNEQDSKIVNVRMEGSKSIIDNANNEQQEYIFGRDMINKIKHVFSTDDISLSDLTRFSRKYPWTKKDYSYLSDPSHLKLFDALPFIRVDDNIKGTIRTFSMYEMYFIFE